MADRVVLVPALPGDLMRDFGVPSEMLDDLGFVAQIPIECIEELTARLEAAEGFLDERRLESLVKESIPDERIADAAVRAILSTRSGRVGHIMASLREWREGDPKNAARFPDKTFTAVQERLPRLAQGFPALERFRKAVRLRGLTGDQVEDCDLVCDARPIYDAQRERIEGFVTVTTLRVAYQRQSGESEVAEYTLSRDMLNELLDQVQKALQKQAVLTASINEWVPDGLADSIEQ